ncbi:MAG: hypothetical protein H6Q16_1570 [Bacteroidetes bacterium]|nr:hypothetical protein [Bacteroidota bacterium]
MESIKRDNKKDNSIEYIQIDCFFCEKCLEQKQIIKRHYKSNYGSYEADK